MSIDGTNARRPNDRPRWKPRKAMVLAAGLGTRMRHLSLDRPKPLTRLAGRTLLDRVLDRLADAGVEEAIVNVHYLADQIEAALAERSTPRISISDERDQLLNTGGGVVKALPGLGAEPFFIHNSDSIWLAGPDDNLARLASTWDDARMDTILMLAPITTSIGYDGHGDFNLASDGKIQRRAASRESPFVFAGVSIAHPRLFAEAPVGAFSLNELWDRAISTGRGYGLRMSGTWMHVGTPEALAEAERCMRGDDDDA